MTDIQDPIDEGQISTPAPSPESTPAPSPVYLDNKDPIRKIAEVNSYQQSPQVQIQKELSDSGVNQPPQEKPKDPGPQTPVDRTAEAIGIADHIKNAMATPIPKPPTAGETGSFLANKAENYAKQAAGGVLDAVQNTWNSIVDLGEWFDDNAHKLGLTDSSHANAFEASKTAFASDLIPPPTSWDEGLVRGVTSFVVPFAGWAKAFRVGSAVTTLGKMGLGAAAGMATNATAMDPHSQGLSDLIQSYPPLQNPLSAYLASNPNDSNAEGRFKNVIGGLGLGALGEGLFYGAKVLYGSKVAQEASQTASHMAPETPTIPTSPELNAGAGKGADLPYSYSPMDVSQSTEGKIVYHGTKSNISSIELARPSDTSRIRNAYGDGLYLTDNPNVAQSYAGKTGKVLPGKLGDLNLLDLEKPLPPDVMQIIKDHLPRDSEVSLDNFKNDPGKDVFKELQLAHQDTESTHSDMADVYQGITASLDDAGYQGLRHEGGGMGGNKGPHNVVVLFGDETGSVSERIFPHNPETIAAQGEPPPELHPNQGPELAPKAPQNQPEVPGIPSGDKSDTVLDILSQSAATEAEGKALSETQLPNPPKAGNLDLTRRNIPEQTKAILARTQQLFEDTINEMKRGTMTEDQINQLSKHNGMSVQELANRPIGQALNAEQIRSATQIVSDSAQNVFDAMEKATGPDASLADKATFLQAWNTHRILQAQQSGAVAEIGRAMRTMQMETGLSSSVDRARLLKNMIDMSGGPDAVDDILKAVRNLKDSGAPLSGLGEAARRSIVMQTKDAIANTTISWMLSNPKTWAIKALSDVYSTGSRVIEKAGAAVIGKVRQTLLGVDSGERITFGQVGGDIMGIAKSMDDAWYLGKAAAKTGQSVTDPMRSMGDFVTGYKFQQDPTLIDRAAQVMSAYGFGPRILNGITEGAKTLNYGASIYSQAIQEAEKRGLEGPEFSKFVSDLFDRPSYDMMQKAQEFSQDATFTKPLQGPYAAVSDFIKNIPGLRLLVPFHKISLNLLDYELQRNPFTFWATKQMQTDLSAGGIQRDMALSKLAMGSAATYWVLKKVGDGTITGGSPANKDMGSIWKSDGKQPYSMKIGDAWYSYSRLEPLGGLLASAADIGQLYSDINARNPDDYEHMVIATAAMAAYHMTPKFLMDSVGNLEEAMRDPESKKPERVLQEIASMPVSGLPLAITRMIDPVKRDTTADSANGSMWHFTDSILNKYKASLPWFSKDLPPQMNMFGEPIVMGPGYGWDSISPVYMSKESDSPGVKEMLRLGIVGRIMNPEMDPEIQHLQAKMPSRYIRQNGVATELSPEEYSKYVQLSAGIGLRGFPMTLKERLDNLADSDFAQLGSSSQNDNQRRILINKTINAYRFAAQQQLGVQDAESGGDIQSRMHDLIRRRTESLRPGYQGDKSGSLGFQ